MSEKHFSDLSVIAMYYGNKYISVDEVIQVHLRRLIQVSLFDN